MTKQTAAQSEQPMNLIGVDDGFAYVKLVDANGYRKYRSTVKAGAHAVAQIFGNEEDDTRGYITEGLPYTAGESISGEDTRFDGYIGSPLNRVLVHHALHASGYAGKEVRIATGMPVESFYKGNDINSEAMTSKHASIAVPVEPMNGDKPVIIKGNIVCSEGVAAFLDYFLDMDGNPVREMSEYPVGIVDIGGRTTDCVWVCPPSAIDHSRSGTENVGVLDVMAAVENALRKEHQLQNVSRLHLEHAISKGSIKVFGKDVDVRDIVNEAKNTVMERIMREVERKLGNGAELEAVIFVGGGSAMMPEIAKRYPNAMVPEHPEFANARGMYKYLRYTTKNGK